MKIVCNAGTVSVNQMGHFDGYGDVWYHPNAIANILSLHNVQKKFRVTYDSVEGNQFIIHRPDGTKRRFYSTDKGLYSSSVMDVTGRTTENSSPSMVTTVEENLRSFTKREQQKA